MCSKKLTFTLILSLFSFFLFFSLAKGFEFNLVKNVSLEELGIIDTYPIQAYEYGDYIYLLIIERAYVENESAGEPESGYPIILVINKTDGSLVNNYTFEQANMTQQCANRGLPNCFTGTYDYVIIEYLNENKTEVYQRGSIQNQSDDYLTFIIVGDKLYFTGERIYYPCSGFVTDCGEFFIDIWDANFSNYGENLTIKRVNITRRLLPYDIINYDENYYYILLASWFEEEVNLSLVVEKRLHSNHSLVWEWSTNLTSLMELGFSDIREGKVFFWYVDNKTLYVKYIENDTVYDYITHSEPTFDRYTVDDVLISEGNINEAWITHLSGTFGVDRSWYIDRFWLGNLSHRLQLDRLDFSWRPCDVRPLIYVPSLGTFFFAPMFKLYALWGTPFLQPIENVTHPYYYRMPTYYGYTVRYSVGVIYTDNKLFLFGDVNQTIVNNSLTHTVAWAVYDVTWWLDVDCSYPPYNATLLAGNVTFEFNFSSSFDFDHYCYIDLLHPNGTWIYIRPSEIIPRGQYNGSITVYLEDGGSYSGYLLCEPYFNRMLVNSTSLNFELVRIEITIISPPNNTISNSAANDFVYQVQGSVDSYLCSLKINGIIISNTTSNNTQVTNTLTLDKGVYIWNVTCEARGVSNSTDNLIFEYYYPELVVYTTVIPDGEYYFTSQPNLPIYYTCILKYNTSFEQFCAIHGYGVSAPPGLKSNGTLTSCTFTPNLDDYNIFTVGCREYYNGVEYSNSKAYGIYAYQYLGMFLPISISIQNLQANISITPSSNYNTNFACNLSYDSSLIYQNDNYQNGTTTIASIGINENQDYTTILTCEEKVGYAWGSTELQSFTNSNSTTFGCVCTGWVEAGCIGVNMSYTRTCNPSGCSAEYMEAYSSECEHLVKLTGYMIFTKSMLGAGGMLILGALVVYFLRESLSVKTLLLIFLAFVLFAVAMII